jgi:hypothetical protein
MLGSRLGATTVCADAHRFDWVVRSSHRVAAADTEARHEQFRREAGSELPRRDGTEVAEYEDHEHIERGVRGRPSRLAQPRLVGTNLKRVDRHT